MSNAFSSAEINGIARCIVTKCNEEAAKALHVAICELLQKHNAASFDGIMALLWTAIHSTTLMARRLEDGATLNRNDAERVLIVIMDGPEPLLDGSSPKPSSPLNSPGGMS